VGFCVHATATTRGCMNVHLDNLQKPVEYQDQRLMSHGFLCIFCLYDTRGQYLALSDGFTCLIVIFADALATCLRV